MDTVTCTSLLRGRVFVTWPVSGQVYTSALKTYSKCIIKKGNRSRVDCLTTIQYVKYIVKPPCKYCGYVKSISAHIKDPR